MDTDAEFDAAIARFNAQMTPEIEAWLAIIREFGAQIDPETAEVEWRYALTVDPYGVCPNVPEELQQVGREYFARAPGSNIWVDFGDLPEATRTALEQKFRPSPTNLWNEDVATLISAVQE